MPKTHELKTDFAVFQQSWIGNKDWEVRFNGDRDFEAGDIVVSRETYYSSEEMSLLGKPLRYTGRQMRGKIVCVLKDAKYAIAPGWCIFSIPWDGFYGGEVAGQDDHCWRSSATGEKLPTPQPRFYPGQQD